MFSQACRQAFKTTFNPTGAVSKFANTIPNAILNNALPSALPKTSRNLIQYQSTPHPALYRQSRRYLHQARPAAARRGLMLINNSDGRVLFHLSPTAFCISLAVFHSVFTLPVFWDFAKYLWRNHKKAQAEATEHQL
jgi:hypothetical protein